MIYKQIDIFGVDKVPYKISKPVRLIELFAGKGSQFEALKQLQINHQIEHYKIVEWSFKSTNAYNLTHVKDFKDYSLGVDKSDLIKRINGVSLDYNAPITIEKLQNKPLKWLRKVYNDVVATNNLVDIMKVKGVDLEIKDKDKYEYLMTYSFPCQDLSSAGLGKGLSESQANGGTRSGLLWEVERILNELEENKPQILLMENVPNLLQKKHVRNFEKWETKLSELGYKNYIKVIDGTDYAIPQIRKRVIMLSILGENHYNFPRRMQLKRYLNYFLEDTVDRKYFLTEKNLRHLTAKVGKFDRLTRFKRTLPETSKKNGIANAILTSAHGISAMENYVIVPEKTIKGYAVANVGDGIYINRPHQKRGVVQKGKIQTLKTSVADLGVVVLDDGKVNVRRLTPKETNRIMGFSDKNYQLLAQSDLKESDIYHANGDSIIVTVSMAVLGVLFITEEQTINKIESYIERIKI